MQLILSIMFIIVSVFNEYFLLVFKFPPSFVRHFETLVFLRNFHGNSYYIIGEVLPKKVQLMNLTEVFVLRLKLVKYYSFKLITCRILVVFSVLIVMVLYTYICSLLYCYVGNCRLLVRTSTPSFPYFSRFEDNLSILLYKLTWCWLQTGHLVLPCPVSAIVKGCLCLLTLL